MAGNRADGRRRPTAVLDLPGPLSGQTSPTRWSVDDRGRAAGRSASGSTSPPSDMGRVIGRRGRTAQAIRTLVGVAGARDGVQTSVDIVDD